MFPFFFNLKNRHCVIIGGGSVGQRKARKLLACEARVRVVCLEKPPAETNSQLEWRTEPYQPHHLDSAFLVFAAATAEVNRRVVADARERGILVNSATEPESGDFFVPAVVQRGDLTVAVSTGGKAPGLAREARLLLEEYLDEHFAQWLELVGELRAEIMERIANQEKRQEIMAKLCERSWLERLRREEMEQIRRAMRQEVEALVNAKDESV